MFGSLGGMGQFGMQPQGMLDRFGTRVGDAIVGMNNPFGSISGLSPQDRQNQISMGLLQLAGSVEAAGHRGGGALEGLGQGIQQLQQGGAQNAMMRMQGLKFQQEQEQYARDKARLLAQQEAIAKEPTDQQSFDTAFPDEFARNKLAMQNMQRNMGLFGGIFGVDNGTGQPTADTPAVPPQVGAAAPVSPPAVQDTAQAIPAPVGGAIQQAPNMPAPVDPASIPIPQAIRKIAAAASMGSKDGVAAGAKIMLDYQTHQADQINANRLASPEYAASKKIAEGKAQQELDKPAQALTVQTTVSSLDSLKQAAQEIKDSPALSKITGLMGHVPNLPGGEAANLSAQFDTLTSKIAFSVLQAMRDASKTGGALGQVSNYEEKMLRDNLAALDLNQGPAAMQKSLQKIIDYVDGAKSRVTDAYKQTYNEDLPSAVPVNKGPDVTGIDPKAVQMLRANPSSAAQFDEAFGPGSAAKILGK